MDPTLSDPNATWGTAAMVLSGLGLMLLFALFIFGAIIYRRRKQKKDNQTLP